MKILISLLYLLIATISFAKQTTEISGRITNSQTGEPIFNVSIYLVGTYIGTTTNKDGYYTLKIPTGKQTLKFYHLVYNKKEIELDIKKDSVYTLNIELEEIVLQLGTVTVQGKRDIPTSNYIINERSIKNMPALAEPDIMRAVSFLPGIVQYSDYNVELNIRGGWSDQNKILYDDVEVYNPYHLFGIFSAFNLWTIDEVRVWSANFPAQYGGKLSGIVSMKSKPQSSKPFTKLNVSLIMANLALSRKFGDTFVMFAARRPYLDLLMALVGQTDMLLRMYDLNLKVSHKFSNNFAADLILFASNEGGTFDEGENNNKSESDSGNRVIATKFNYKKHQLLFSFFRNLLDGKDNTSFANNRFDDFNVKYFTELIYDNHRHQFGANYQYLHAIYNWNMKTVLAEDDFLKLNIPDSLYKISKFSNYSIWFDSKLFLSNTIQLGVKNIFYYGNNTTYFSPGISFEWHPHSKYRFTIGAERNYQFTTTGISTSNIFMVGNPIFILDKPISANIYSIGNKLNLGGGYNVSMELYYKNYDRVVKLNNDFENYPNFIDGSGTAYGIELFLEKRTGRVTYQINYSYLKTSYKFSNKNFNPSWNLPHTLKGLLGVMLGKTWKFNLSLIYRSGALYQKAIGYYKGIGTNAYEDINKYEIWRLEDHLIFDKNKYRFNPYWRLDVSLRKQYSNKYFDWELYIQIQNITFNSNALEVYSTKYAKSTIINGKHGDSSYLPGLPILPSVGVEFTF